MDKKFVRVLADVHCDWEGLAPTYRVYVDNELFAERSYTWTNAYLEEMLQIEAEAGDYLISFELVPPHLAKMRVENIRVDFGPGVIVDNNKVRII